MGIGFPFFSLLLLLDIIVLSNRWRRPLNGRGLGCRTGRCGRQLKWVTFSVQNFQWCEKVWKILLTPLKGEVIEFQVETSFLQLHSYQSPLSFNVFVLLYHWMTAILSSKAIQKTRFQRESNTCLQINRNWICVFSILTEPLAHQYKLLKPHPSSGLTRYLLSTQ